MTRKRKKSKASPGEEKQHTQRKRREKKANRSTMENDFSSGNGNSEQVHLLQNTPQNTQTQQYSPNISYMYPPPAFNMTASPYQALGSMTSGASQTGQATPISPGTDILSLIMKRLDSMDNKLARLDSIQTSVNNINTRIQNMDKKINDLEGKMRDVEHSRTFDSQTITDLSKHQKEMECFIQKMKMMENDHLHIEKELKAEIKDLKCRSMRDNLLFHGILEEKDEQCEMKILKFVQEKLKIENAQENIRLQRAHRIGPYKAGKTRPIVAKFTDFPDREKVRRSAKQLKGTEYGISEQFPREVVEQRRKLIPIMLQARKDGKEAFLKVDKLFINNQEYKDQC